MKGNRRDSSRFGALSIKYLQILNGTLNLHNNLKLLCHYQFSTDCYVLQ